MKTSVSHTLPTPLFLGGSWQPSDVGLMCAVAAVGPTSCTCLNSWAPHSPYLCYYNLRYPIRSPLFSLSYLQLQRESPHHLLLLLLFFNLILFFWKGKVIFTSIFGNLFHESNLIRVNFNGFSC